MNNSDNLISKDISYPSGDEQISAYYVYPKGAKGKLPGLIIIHAIFGLNENIRDVSNRFAQQGYAVLAPHLYSRKGSPPIENVQKALQFMFSIPPEKQRDQAYTQEQMQKLPAADKEIVAKTLGWMMNRDYSDNITDLKSALNWLEAQGEVDNKKMGSLGFCMGGTLSRRLASSGADLKATVIFYGENPPKDQINNIKPPILGLYGGEDHRITDNVPELENEMKRANKNFEYHVYPGAHHAFFDDTAKNYNKSAADDSWKRVNDFFSATLK